MKKFLLSPTRIRQILFGLLFLLIQPFGIQAQITECGLTGTYTIEGMNSTFVQECTPVRLNINLCNTTNNDIIAVARFDYEVNAYTPIDLTGFISLPHPNTPHFGYWGKEVVVPANQCIDVSLYVIMNRGIVGFTKTGAAMFPSQCPAGFIPLPGRNNISSQSTARYGLDNTTTYMSTIVSQVGSALPNQLLIKGTLVVDGNYELIETSATNYSNIYLGKGAKIIIKNGSSLTLQKVNVQGCANQWESIEVENGGTLSIGKKSSIKDAQTAIKALPGANVVIDKVLFEDNKIGISAEGNYATAIPTVANIAVAGSEFRGTGSFKPYSGLTLTREVGIPIAGILSCHDFFIYNLLIFIIL